MCAHARIVAPGAGRAIPHLWNGRRCTWPLGSIMRYQRRGFRRRARPGPAGRPDRARSGTAVRRGEMTMNDGARTPEELEMLFEDALVVRDPQMLAELFEEGAVFIAGQALPARG